MQRTKPPFRADHVGSLLRPAALKQARERRAKGEIGADQLKAEMAQVQAQMREVSARLGKLDGSGEARSNRFKETADYYRKLGEEQGARAREQAEKAGEMARKEAERARESWTAMPLSRCTVGKDPAQLIEHTRSFVYQLQKVRGRIDSSERRSYINNSFSLQHAKMAPTGVTIHQEPHTLSPFKSSVAEPPLVRSSPDRS